MANYCSYWMKVVSSNDKDLIKFANHIMSINDNDFVIGLYYDKGECPDLVNYEFGIHHSAFEFHGGCPWSGYSCVHDTNRESNEGKTLTTLSRELNLTIELFTDGDGFREHYIIKDGVVTTEESEDYYELYFEDYDIDTDDGIKEFIEDNRSDFENAGYENVTVEQVRDMIAGNVKGVESVDNCYLLLESDITGEYTI